MKTPYPPPMVYALQVFVMPVYDTKPILGFRSIDVGTGIQIIIWHMNHIFASQPFLRRGTGHQGY